MLEAVFLKDRTKSVSTILDIVYITLQKEYFMGHSVNRLLCICWNTFIDYLSGVLYCVVYGTITLFVQFWSKFSQTFRREQSTVTLFESPKEIRETKKVFSLAFMVLPFWFFKVFQSSKYCLLAKFHYTG